MESFTRYDALAKRIRRLPCSKGAGSSQDRVQIAVMTRASLFLQKNMVPLQVSSTETLADEDAYQLCSKSLSTRKRITPPEPATAGDASNDDNFTDVDSKVAFALQPLLEQEALLESFVEEARSQRKFEDVKTLKVNLGEIRAEIEKILAHAQEQRASRAQ